MSDHNTALSKTQPTRSPHKQRTCRVCGSLFLSNAPSTICGPECHRTIHKEHIARNNKKAKGKNLRRAWCGWCDKEFVASGIHKYCSKPCAAEAKKLYPKINRAKIAKKQREYYRDPVNRVSNRIRGRLREKIKHKTARPDTIYGYSGQEYIIHLKKDPNFESWENNPGAYHIDHIIPLSAYTFSSGDISEVKKAMNPRNLRIVPAKENLVKAGKIDIELIESHGIVDLLPKKLTE